MNLSDLQEKEVIVLLSEYCEYEKLLYNVFGDFYRYKIYKIVLGLK